jgi:hypothetical protein
MGLRRDRFQAAPHGRRIGSNSGRLGTQQPGYRPHRRPKLLLAAAWKIRLRNQCDNITEACS